MAHANATLPRLSSSATIKLIHYRLAGKVMLPIISGREGDRIKIEVTVDLSGSMLEAEESILRAVNAVGNVATGEALKR
jgi:hypothetical protein